MESDSRPLVLIWKNVSSIADASKTVAIPMILARSLEYYLLEFSNLEEQSSWPSDGLLALRPVLFKKLALKKVFSNSDGILPVRQLEDKLREVSFKRPI